MKMVFLLWLVVPPLVGIALLVVAGLIAYLLK